MSGIYDLEEKGFRKGQCVQRNFERLSGGKE
jgi:hypothetical protein